MKRFLTYLVILVLGSAAYAQDYFEQGRQEFYKPDYYKAQKLFLKELQNNPENYPCRYFLAHTYVYNGEIAKAKKEYSKIITFAPTPALQKLAMQSMYNLNHSESVQTPNVGSVDAENYFDLIKLDENYVRWAKFPITVYVAPSGYSSLIKTAFSHWQKVSGGFVQFNFVGNISNAQITVSTVDALSVPYDERFEAGHAIVNAKNNIIYRANIELLKINPKTGEAIPEDIVFTTALHEIGHALGLQGHSNNNADLMSAVNARGKKSITKRDLNTLKMLYKHN